MRANFFAILLRFAPVCFLGLLDSHALHLWQFGWVMILPPLFLYPMRPAALVDFGDQIAKIYQGQEKNEPRSQKSTTKVQT